MSGKLHLGVLGTTNTINFDKGGLKPTYKVSFGTSNRAADILASEYLGVTLDPCQSYAELISSLAKRPDV